METVSKPDPGHEFLRLATTELQRLVANLIKEPWFTTQLLETKAGILNLLKMAHMSRHSWKTRPPSKLPFRFRTGNKDFQIITGGQRYSCGDILLQEIAAKTGIAYFT